MDNTQRPLDGLVSAISSLDIAESETSVPSSPVLTPSSSTATLVTLTKSQRRNAKRKEKRRKSREENRSRDVVAEFNVYFGGANVLENWKGLCKDLGVKDWEKLTSITQCKKALKGIWVNIYDLLDAVVAGTCPPGRFATESALSKYTWNTDRIYPKDEAKKGGPVRALLAHIFH